MNILIVKTSAIGDVTHTMPALNCLRNHFPEAHITWLVEEAASDLIVGHKSVNRVLVAKRQKWVREFRGGACLSSIKKLRQFVKELREREYDLVIDFQGLLKSGIWVWLSKGKQRVGFGKGMQHSECSYIFLNNKVPAVDMEIHALDRELLLLAAIDVPCDKVIYNFPITESHRQKIDKLLKDAGFQKEKQGLVAINPQTKWETKLWYNDRFAEVADSLAARGVFVVFTGGGADRGTIREIQENMVHSSLDLTGKSSLKELAALYEQADVVISTDTGPMHISAAVGTPVVALFGPTAPWRTGPHGDGHHVLRNAMPCSPCFKRQCLLEKDIKKCMNSIRVSQVVDATVTLLEKEEQL
jgi:lipopolysaccharide heptosyltransferase I